MAIQDRRSGHERRTMNRYTVDIPVEWESDSLARNSGSLSDISFEGCFVLTSGDVKDGEAVRLFIPFGDGMKVQFAGSIANHVVEIGFGVKFDPLSNAQKELLTGLLESFGRV